MPPELFPWVSPKNKAIKTTGRGRRFCLPILPITIPTSEPRLRPAGDVTGAGAESGCFSGVWEGFSSAMDVSNDAVGAPELVGRSCWPFRGVSDGIVVVVGGCC